MRRRQRRKNRTVHIAIAAGVLGIISSQIPVSSGIALADDYNVGGGGGGGQGLALAGTLGLTLVGAAVFGHAGAIAAGSAIHGAAAGAAAAAESGAAAASSAPEASTTPSSSSESGLLVLDSSSVKAKPQQDTGPSSTVSIMTSTGQVGAVSSDGTEVTGE